MKFIKTFWREWETNHQRVTQHDWLKVTTSKLSVDKMSPIILGHFWSILVIFAWALSLVSVNHNDFKIASGLVFWSGWVNFHVVFSLVMLKILIQLKIWSWLQHIVVMEWEKEPWSKLAISKRTNGIIDKRVKWNNIWSIQIMTISQVLILLWGSPDDRYPHPATPTWCLPGFRFEYIYLSGMGRVFNSSRFSICLWWLCCPSLYLALSNLGQRRSLSWRLG